MMIYGFKYYYFNIFHYSFESAIFNQNHSAIQNQLRKLILLIISNKITDIKFTLFIAKFSSYFANNNRNFQFTSPTLMHFEGNGPIILEPRI